MNSVQCTVCSVQCAVYSVQCKVPRVQVPYMPRAEVCLDFDIWPGHWKQLHHTELTFYEKVCVVS